MKTLVLIILAGIWGTSLNAQNSKINNSNYFEYYNRLESPKVTTNWLRKGEIINIVLEELEKYKFKHNYDNVLYQIPSHPILILDVFSQKQNIGFLIQTGHHALPDKEYRMIKTYDSVKYDHNGNMERFEIDQLPNNIHLLLETNYWYQYENSKDEINDAVCRSKIIQVLREDIAEILAKYKNLEDALSEKEWIGVSTDLSSLKLTGFIAWAEFPDGQIGIDNYIKQEIGKLINSGKITKNEEIIVEYWINVDGKTEKIKFIEGSISSIEKEVKQIIENMPSWKPAKQNGKPINSKYQQKIMIAVE